MVTNVTLPEFMDMVYKYKPDTIYNHKPNNKLFFIKMDSDSTSRSFSTYSDYSKLLSAASTEKVFLLKMNIILRNEKILKLRNKCLKN